MLPPVVPPVEPPVVPVDPPVLPPVVPPVPPPGEAVELAVGLTVAVGVADGLVVAVAEGLVVTVAVGVADGDEAGATVIVAGSCAEPTALVAVRVRLNVPACVGVPLIVAVLVALVNVSPGGSPIDAVTVAPGWAVTVTVELYGTPTVAVVAGELLKTGAMGVR